MRRNEQQETDELLFILRLYAGDKVRQFRQSFEVAGPWEEHLTLAAQAFNRLNGSPLEEQHATRLGLHVARGLWDFMDPDSHTFSQIREVEQALGWADDQDFGEVDPNDPIALI